MHSPNCRQLDHSMARAPPPLLNVCPIRVQHPSSTPRLEYAAAKCSPFLPPPLSTTARYSRIAAAVSPDSCRESAWWKEEHWIASARAARALTLVGASRLPCTATWTRAHATL